MGITAINGIAITASLTNTASYARSVSGAAVSNTATYYPFFSTVNGGTSNLFTNGNLIYNPGVGQLTALYFSASSGFLGTASVANTASKANQIDTGIGSGNATNYLIFTPTFNAGGTAPINVSESSNCIYNPSTFEFRGGLVNNTSNGSKVSTSDANLTIDASLTQSMTWIASLTTTRSLIINNLTDGREVQVYIRNTNATQRQIIFSASTTTTGHTPVNMSAGAGAASVTTQNIAGTSGTMYVLIRTISSTFAGGIM